MDAAEEIALPFYRSALDFNVRRDVMILFAGMLFTYLIRIGWLTLRSLMLVRFHNNPLAFIARFCVLG